MVVRLHRFTRADYHRMVQAGVLHEDDRVELIEGVITRMSPIGPHHNAVVDFLNEFFVERLQKRAVVRIQGSIVLGERTEPQPDIALLKRHTDGYHTRPAGPEDVLLLIEVADASVEADRGRKARLYARHGIVEYWVIDLIARHVVVHRGPAAQGYSDVTESAAPATVAPAAFSDVQLSIADCLG